MARLTIDRLHIKLARGADPRAVERAIATALAGTPQLCRATAARAPEAARTIGAQVSLRVGAGLRAKRT